MALAKEKAIAARVRKISQMIKENNVSASIENINSMFKSNILVNQNEYDLRFTVKEIDKYPNAKNHKKLQDNS